MVFDYFKTETRGEFRQRFGCVIHRVRRLPPPADKTLREIEMQAIHDALDRHHGNKPSAARQLGISLKTLYNKLNQAAPLGKTA